MAYAGKFIDRNPNIVAAGRSSAMSDLAACLNRRTIEEEVEATLAMLPAVKPIEYHQPKARAAAHTGYYTQVRELLSPPRRRVFQHLRDELKETAYKSYWTNEVGRVPDQVPGLPFGMDPETTVFGRPSSRDNTDGDTVENLVFPKRPFGEAKLEEELGINLYQRSHGHYLVGQRRDLLYDAPEHVVYGKSEYLDQTGKNAKKCMQWFTQAGVSRTSKGQARLRERTHHEMGKPLTPNNILEQVGEGHVFGISTKFDDSGAREGMRLGPIDKRKQVNGEYINFLCSIRKSIKNRNPPFPFFELSTNLKLLDEGGCGCLPLPLVYDVCGRLGLHFDREMLEIILKHLGVIHGENNDQISYYGFCNILDFRKPLPDFKKVDDLPDELKYYQSTYQALTKDLERKGDYGNIRRAGVPLLRTDREDPGDARCKGDQFLLVDETTVDSCLRPSIFNYYGLTHRDFLKLRSKDYMKDLLKRIGLEIPDIVFDKMWTEGLKREENEGNMICIETFRNMLDEMCAAKLAEVRGA